MRTSGPVAVGARAVSLRTALMTLLVGTVAYVAVVGLVLSVRIAPAAGRAQSRSRSVVEEYRASDLRVLAMDSVEQRLGALIDSARGGTWRPEELERLRVQLQRIEENARTLERLGPPQDAQDSLSAVLAGGVNNEELLRSTLLACVADLELRDIDGAERLMRRVRALDPTVRAVVSRATAIALRDVSREEDALAGTARSTTRFVTVWFVLGAAAFPLLLLFLRRRLYVPLARLDRGLARIASGDLDVALSAPVDDELGRVIEHFNRMTAMLRERATQEEERTERESAARTRAILDSALDAVVVIDADGMIREWSPQAEVVFGWKRAEVIGRSATSILEAPASGDGASTRPPRNAAEGAQRLVGRRIETVARRRDGTVIPVELAVTQVRRGAHPEYGAFIRDLTESRRMEMALRQSQKMDAVGRLAGGIAHDFNNLLTAIMGQADLVRRAEGASSQIREDAAAIFAAAGRGSELARKMLTLARRSQGRADPVDPDHVVQSVVDLLGRAGDRRIEIALDLSVHGAALRGDESELINAMLNLAINARDAMPDGGRIDISTRLVTLDGKFVAPHFDAAAAGEYVAIAVRDSGSGMSEETRARIFEPFFTTKPPGAGTGLGLAMVYGTVRSHRGIVTVDTAPGAGTTITMYLPLDRAQAAPEVASGTEVRHGRGRVLVVDDEDAVRKIVSRMLDWLGYEVDTASDGKEAVERVTESPDRWDLVLLDNSMPRMTGKEAGRIIHEMRPDLPLVLSSGYFDSASDALADAGVFRDLIPKPYDMAKLSRVMSDHVRLRD